MRNRRRGFLTTETASRHLRRASLAVLGRQVELLLQGLRDIRPLAADADGARRTDGVGGADAAGVWGGVRQMEMLVDGVDLMI